MGVLIFVIAYELVTIVGVGLWVHSRQKKSNLIGHGDEFIAAGRSLPAPIVGASIALAVLGAVHVLGIMEMAWGQGAIAVWFSISHVTLICVICLATGRFIRRMKVSTVPEMVGKLYNKKIVTVVVAVIAAQTFAILTMEVQALGVTINTLSGGALSILMGTIVGAVFGILYVFIAGMKEIGWVNMINTVVMYVALIIAVVYMAGRLFDGAGWDAVGDYYASQSDPTQQAMANIFGTLGKNGTLFGIGISLVIATTFAQSISQMGLASTMAAKNEKTVVKALWIAAPVNGLFGIFTMMIGIAARAGYESGYLDAVSELDAATQAKAGGLALLVSTLPSWVLGLLLAAFLGAILSTFAITTLSLGTIFAKDIYMRKHPNASERTQVKYVRLFIVIAAILAVIATTRMPAIINGASWAFAWLAPIFWVVIYGLFWKRNNLTTGIVFAVSWILVLLWTFTPLLGYIGLGGIPIPYITLAVSLVLGILLNAALPGGKPGYFKEQKALKALAAAGLKGEEA
ncbi:MAG: sodium:solute symporter family protein [Clostridiales Family XIII bacterium]|jgi:SSS family solute:Na+ symporter|nr:sodium:solute symporter family protein [Clostridiales Family XIII bacterium]